MSSISSFFKSSSIQLNVHFVNGGPFRVKHHRQSVVNTLHNDIEVSLITHNPFCLLLTDAAGNFLCPASSLSFNAFKTVMEIDTMGTFNTSKVVYEKWFHVRFLSV